MPGLLSLPSELLYEIVQIRSQADRCRLRATCKILNEHADPIVFHRLKLYLKTGSLHVTENQIVALATRSSKACELTKDTEICFMPNSISASELSWPHFGHCDDLRVHLPTAISTLTNMTSFRWLIGTSDPDWLVDSVIWMPYSNSARLFVNLSKLSVLFSNKAVLPEDLAFRISQMAAAIANSPQLKCLDVSWWADDVTLSKLFAKLSAKNPLHLEHLRICSVDATVDQQILPHLAQLTSFLFDGYIGNIPTARSLWTSLRLNNIKLSDVEICGIITEEVMLYLSSFSGLKRLVVGLVNASNTLTENIKNMLFMEVLPKHVNSLHTLKIRGNYDRQWAFSHDNSTSITKCLKLKDLAVYIDGKENSMPVQRLLDTVACLPELKILRFSVINKRHSDVDLADLEPRRGLRYVEELCTGKC